MTGDQRQAPLSGSGPETAAPFGSSREHLYAELARLDLLMQRQVWRWRQTGAPDPQGGDEFRGLYVSDAEVDSILCGVYPGSEEVNRQVAGQRVEESFSQALDRAAGSLAQRRAASAERGVSLHLERLRALFDLTPFDVDAFLLSLAPEIDLRYERIYAYLQDDVTRKRPGVAMSLNVLCDTSGERLSARTRFLADAPLVRHQLIALYSDPTQTHPPLLAHYLKPDPRIVEYLLRDENLPGQEDLDSRLGDSCEVEHPSVPPPLFLPPDVQDQLADLTTLSRPTGEPSSPPATVSPLIILFQGETGTGKHTAARSICAAWGRPLLTVHLGRIPAQDFGTLVRLAVREAHLRGAGVCWRGTDALISGREEGDPTRPSRRRAYHDALLAYPVVSFVALEDMERQPDCALLRAPRMVRVRFPRPLYPLRRALWDHCLDEALDEGTDLDTDGVAGRFRLTGGQIHDAVLDARHRARQRPPRQQAITVDDLFAAARARTSGQLIDLAKKIDVRHTWDDLVLPDDQIAQLHEMCDQMRYRPLVLGEWGFDRKLSLGKGLNALFAGPSGTGKTMAAEVIAGGLGLDLYKIDLSTVVSKYVGETEKNLERIFGAARNSNAILFFDEADALFGKRSEVRDAHDRYANVEISYLLQKMEEYDGLVILTTNLSKNIDDAFMRRMHFTVEYPYPEEEARRRIWQIAFPDGAPLAQEVDLDWLADRYRLTGGNIRNVALTAAFLAARDGSTQDNPGGKVIGMEHLLWATRREFQKMGRLADEREFEMRQSAP